MKTDIDALGSGISEKPCKFVNTARQGAHVCELFLFIDAFQNRPWHHFSIGAILVFLSSSFPAAPEAPGRFPEERRKKNHLLLLLPYYIFLSRMHCSRVPEAPGSYPEGSRKQTYGTMK